MSPIVFAALVWFLSDSGEDRVQLELLRREIEDLKNELSAARAASEPETAPWWHWLQSRSVPVSPAGPGTLMEFDRGPFVQRIVDGEMAYIHQMNERIVTDY